MSKNISGVGEVETPSTLKEKLQNFWYHYKWHSIVALFLVVAILVCSLQFCAKEKYDAHIAYIGSKQIGRTTENGDISEIEKVISSLKRLARDFDENGEIAISFTNYYFLSTDEEKNTSDVNDALLASDRKSISSLLEHSEYYLLFISPAVYEQYNNVSDYGLFISLDEYKAKNPSLRYYKDNAIYLSSLDAYKLPGLSSLPEDTLVCLRNPSVLAAKSKEHTEYLENAREILENIIELKID